MRRNALSAAAALIALAACAGCRRSPAYRLTYEVDVAHADDGEKDAAKVMAATRDVMARRLHALGLPTTVTVREHDLIVDVPAIKADDLAVARTALGQGGHVAIELVDEEGGAAVFGSPTASASPEDEEIAVYREAAPDGVDESGKRKNVSAFYARVTCDPPSHATETTGECLARFQTWTSRLEVPSDHRVGFEAVVQQDGVDPLRYRQVGWRTMYLFARREITGASLVDASVGRDTEGGGYYVSLKLDPAGAARMEDFTGKNVDRRMAILIEDVVQEAPVIRSKIRGGRATITMGSGDPEKQLQDAKELELTLLSGSLPAPVRLKSAEDLRRK